MDLTALIKTRLEEAFQPRFLAIFDESDLHHGHIAHNEGGRHLAIEIEAICFDAMTRIEAHRAIYALFGDCMPYPLHALKIKLLPFSP